MTTKVEHKRLHRKNEISSWVPNRRSFVCHATFPVLVTRSSYYVMACEDSWDFWAKNETKIRGVRLPICLGCAT